MAPGFLAMELAGQGGAALSMLTAGAHPLAHLNAALNLLATLLLVVGLWRVKARREAAHGKTMLAALAVSAVFLASYVIYHSMVRSVPFTHAGPAKYLYYSVLISHILLAVTVPFLAVAAAFLGLKALGWIGPELSTDARVHYRAKHLRLVRWAYPIWLYVSITGVAVYAMLYHLWPSAAL